MTELFDVLGVDLTTYRVRFMDQGLDEKNAKAVRDMAVFRRGVEVEYFAVVDAGTYAEGDRHGEPSNAR